VTGCAPSRSVCERCHHLLAPADEAIEVGGAHAHTFVNPAGHHHHVRCFARAPGCVSAGETTADHTWFEGCTWQRAFCAACSHHAGWRFRSRALDFFALIAPPG
jgi:hypothetical protein